MGKLKYGVYFISVLFLVFLSSCEEQALEASTQDTGISEETPAGSETEPESQESPPSSNDTPKSKEDTPKASNPEPKQDEGSKKDPEPENKAKASENNPEPENPITKTLQTIAFLITVGQPVLVEEFGSLFSDCTTAAVKSLSPDALALDSNASGLEGCLIYNQQSVISSLNNPLYAPENPMTFMPIPVKESSIVSYLKDQTNKRYQFADVLNLILNKIGYSPYTQDDEGNVASAILTEEPLRSLMNTLASDSGLTENDLKAYRFHTGYNPSGGWEFNAATEKTNLPIECVDSTPLTVCAIQPLRFDYDGTSLSQNNAGPYVLQMEYGNGGFQNEATILKFSDTAPYLNTFLESVKVTIDAADYSVIDMENKLYVADLDPMKDNSGNSAPYSNQDWMTSYPAMSKVNNAYVFPIPSLALDLAVLISDIADLDNLSASEAFTVLNFLTQAMIALPVDGGGYALLGSHGKTLNDWNQVLLDWFNSAGP